MRLKTNYLGLELSNPLVPSASPLSKDLGMVKRLEDAGAPAIVMYSLFEEEIHHEDAELEHYLSYGSESFAEALSYLPESHDFMPGVEGYLNHLQQLKNSVEIPIIASLNGVSISGWTEKASMLEQVGADAIELNVYFMPTDPKQNGTDLKNLYLDILKSVKARVSIPVAMKISPYFSALPNFAKRLEECGADSLVLFNRFYQSDIDLENLEVESSLNLSTSANMRLPLRWIAVLRNIVRNDLAATSGVHTAEDVLKLTMAGADVTMLCAALYKYGPDHIAKLQQDLIQWMDDHEYESLDQMRGSMSMEKVSDPGAFARANYIKMLKEFQPPYQQ